MAADTLSVNRANVTLRWPDHKPNDTTPNHAVVGNVASRTTGRTQMAQGLTPIKLVQTNHHP
jgi:hypothetical protein